MAQDGPSGTPDGTPPQEYPIASPDWQQPSNPPPYAPVSGGPAPVSGGSPTAPISGGGQVAYAPPPPEPGRMKQLWVHPAIVVGVLGTIVILIVAVTILAVNALNASPTAPLAEDDGSPTAEDSAVDEDPAEPGGDGTSPTPGDEETTEASGDEVYLSGTLDLWADSSTVVDFDTGDDYLNGDDDERLYEVEILTDGMHAKGETEFGDWGDGPTPTTAAECEGLATKSDSVHVSRLEQYATFCFNTAEGRIGYFTIEEATLNDNGTLSGLELMFTVFKSADDY